MTNIIYKLSALVFGLAILYSCTDDLQKYSLTMPHEGEFVITASSSALELKETNASSHIAVNFNWNPLTYGISTPVNYTLQIDTLNGTFAKPIEDDVLLNSYTISYTDSILNKKLLNQLKRKAAIESTIRVRLKASLAFGNNTAYSNILMIKVTPYKVSKRVSYLYMPGVVDGDWNNYSVKLCSGNNDGNFEGFVRAAQWVNFKFTDKASGTGTFYGSTPNSLYSLDTSGNMWNIWFDQGGYFLVKADLNKMSWNKTLVTSVCVTGDFNGWSLTANPMTYDAKNKVWTANCNISTIGWGIQFILNDDWGFKYGAADGEPDQVVLGGKNVTPSSSGMKTITLDFSNPEKYIYKIQ